MRNRMRPPNLLTIQLHPHLIKRRKPPLCTLTHTHPMPDLLLDNRRVHAARHFVDGDVAFVKGLGPEDLCVDGDVVDVLDAAVGELVDGDGLAGAGLDVEFVAGLGEVLVEVHVCVGFAGAAGVEMCPDAGGGDGGDGGCKLEEEKEGDLLWL